MNRKFHIVIVIIIAEEKALFDAFDDIKNKSSTEICKEIKEALEDAILDEDLGAKGTIKVEEV